MSRTRLLPAALVPLALILTLSACAPEPPTLPVASPVPSATPSVELGLLACEDLVAPDAVASALTGTDTVAPTPVVAVQPSAAFDSALLRGVGGLSCSWRVGEGQQRLGSGDGDWAYLQLSVLPGAAAQFKPLWAGDTPSTETIEVGGVTASVAQGETGWRISAPVGDAWVQLSIRSSGLMTDTSRFHGMPEGAVAEGLAAVAGEAFSAINEASATPERLAWPALEARTAEAACTGGLDEAGLVSAMNFPADAVPEYVLTDSRASEADSFEGTVRSTAGAFECELRTNGFGGATITVVRGFAPAFDVMTAEDASAAFVPIALEGAVAPEAAIVAVRDDGPRSPIYFTLGETLYQVYSDGSQTVAETIIAQTR